MVQFKSCPRCRGDLNSREDMYGAYRECLQCGHVQDIPRTRKSRLRSAGKPRKEQAA